jgi:tRNA threonylcarbamoyladenosine biosynthesis protein TsaB
MYILAADTASRSCSVAIICDDILVAEMTLHLRQTHSKHLLEMIHRIMMISGLRFSDLDGFAINRGPGSFTGIRIGISCMKGLAYALDKPIVGISSLETLATQAMVSSLVSAHGQMICPVLDARKQEVYIGLFELDGNRLIQKQKEGVCRPEQIGGIVKGPCIFIGEGATRYKEIITSLLGNLSTFAPSFQNYINARTIAYLSLQRFNKNDPDTIAALNPAYIRKSDAELKLINDNQNTLTY